MSVILATVIVIVLIFLQPFDIYANEIAHKNIKLIGYGFCNIIPILLIHFFEGFWFIRNQGKWYIHQELFILLFGFLLISLVSYFYNILIVNDLKTEPEYIFRWFKDFSLPFVPIFIPFWAYLRFRFSKTTMHPTLFESKKEVSIQGNNQNETIKFHEKDFIMARAQSNYVDVFFVKDNLLEKQMIRSTLLNIKSKIPSAAQVHRSFLVNPQQIDKISGNSRKGDITLNYLEYEVPVSPKHFLGLKKYLQNRP
ncbi:LytTR family DNA-binding domain-containing protein [Subsaximicrobium wynnwilliamsii]|uniref:LytTR family DNA-binding domain-containing protein n=1 Tax=Subsaximicrobium wynnwilliamsii TaxID=291179 RepID=UPI0016796422|nr:LytTR family DNA-binding domain-containing protein [Subsaximicrobium wynnwilliamsii]